MDVLECFKKRKTIRGFLDKKVPKGVVEEILNDAHLAPSASNQQPWNFYVISGTALSGLCSTILESHKEKKLAYDPTKGKTIPEEYVARTRKLFKGLRPFIFNLGDEKKGFIENGSFRFYDAPVVIFVSMNKKLPESRMMDIGMAVENMMLSACSRGLGTCAIALTLLYGDVIAAEINVPGDFETVLCIALGYPDEAFPLNKFQSSREDIERFVTWDGFEE